MILAILQARTSSSRLPGKVLKPLLGAPMILRQIERLRRAKRLDALVVATSDHASDAALAAVCSQAGVKVHRGPLDDVLARFMGAAAPFKETEWIVRLTGDCPLADPAIVDQVVAAALDSQADYASNALEPTYPDGLDVEVVRRTALEAIAAEPRSPAEREHVTLALYRSPGRFKILPIKDAVDRSHLRWTVDEPRDFALVETIYEALYPSKPDFGYADILALIAQRPELATFNTDFKRNEGLAKSLAKDIPPGDPPPPALRGEGRGEGPRDAED
jgi:spore coat polysaccharide biosynthesis protein SpsF